MESYTELQNLYGIDTKNTTTANLSYGDKMMNLFHRKVLAKADWPFLHRLRTVQTEASTSFVNLPYDVEKIDSVFVTVSSTRYNPKPAPSRAFWDKLHYSTYDSDTPEYWFEYNGQIGLWPRPSTGGNTISINAKIKVKDLNTADYTTGTITTATNGDETIVLNGTTLTYPMVGRFLRIDYDDSIDSGDGIWYEISSITSTTELELVRKYGGTSIAAGSAGYTIGMMPQLPEPFHDLPEQYAAMRYWGKEKDVTRRDGFKEMVETGVRDLFDEYSIDDLSMVVDDGDDAQIINPNLTLTL